jgi:hypothetical protein
MENVKDKYALSLTKILPVIEDLIPNNIRHEYVTCAIQHSDTTSCEIGAIKAGMLVFEPVFKTYRIINMLSFSLGFGKWIFYRFIKKNKMKKVHNPLTLFKRFVFSTVRACLMLTSYISLFGYGLCTLRRIVGRDLKVNYGIAGLMAAPVVLIDGRLTELNSFLSTKVLSSFYEIFMFRTKFHGLKYGELLLFFPSLVGLAVLCEEYPECVDGLFGPFLKWMFPRN